MSVRTVTGIIIVAVIALLIGWDVYAMVSSGVQGTISDVILSVALGNPIVPFAGGVLCGHLFWPQYRDPPK